MLLLQESESQLRAAGQDRTGLVPLQVGPSSQKRRHSGECRIRNGCR